MTKRVGKARNERTSARVAKIAGKVLAMAKHSADSEKAAGVKFTPCVWSNGAGRLTIAELKALAGSALTQTTDRKARG